MVVDERYSSPLHTAELGSVSISHIDYNVVGTQAGLCVRNYNQIETLP